MIECKVCGRKFDNDISYHECSSLEEQAGEIMHNEWLFNKADQLLAGANNGQITLSA